MQSPSVGRQPLSAPPMMPMPPQPTMAQPPQGPPPPPTADSRLPWPPPPQTPPAEPRLSDTMDRMLRPQGLFQSPWQQPWATPPVNGGLPAGGPTPPPPAAGSYQGGGQYPAGNPQQQYQTEAMGQPGVGYPGGGPGQYAPGQYGPGQYAQGQPPAAQYGPGGQAVADPFSQGQYPPGQYGQGQYPADQYATGQFGPGGQQYGPPGLYGPGVQLGPDGTPIADQKRPLTFGKITLPRSPLLPAIAVAALVVVAVTAVLLSASSGPGSSTGAGGGGAAPTAKSSAPASSDAAQLQAAQALSGLLAQSGSDRSSVIGAVTDVQECGNSLARDAQIFRTDAQNRRALLAKLQVLPDRSALSSAMLSDLTGGWQASASADDDLASWASAAVGHCKGGNKHNPSLLASYNYDGTATNDKVAFTGLWNPLARKDGLITYQNTQI